MEPEKFENNIKKLLDGREIKPSAAGWEKLEQRLEKKQTKRPFLMWIASAAAVAAVFFVLGTLFNAPIASEDPELVEQTIEEPVLKEKKQEPEVIQVAAVEAEAENKDSTTNNESAAKIPVKYAIFDTPVRGGSGEDTLLASEITSEASQLAEEDPELLLVNNTADISESGKASEVTDLEVEALLLLATAELKSDTTFTVNSKDLLHQVEYELEQSFRQKVFEVVKEGFTRAKTAVANRDF